MITLINAQLVTQNGIVSGGVVVGDNGKIIEVFSSKRKTHGRIVDAGGNYVLPGLIEVHGHMREPGLTHKETVPTGTKAAAAGGFTTIIDMPNVKPPTITVDLLKEKIHKIYPNRSYVDYAFFLGVGKDSLNELEKVNPESIAGVKVFMAGHETTPTTIPDDETLSKVFKMLAKRNILLAVHAEDQELINHYVEKFKKTGRTDAALWSEVRPMQVVQKAADRAIKLATRYKTRLYLLHLSTPEEFALVLGAKRKGLEVFGELVSYQLAFTRDDYQRLGNKIKVAPALRTKSDQDVMWELVREEKVDVLCSEHTPHELETKSQPNVWKAQAGTPNIQETLPSLITHWVKKYGKSNLEQGLQTIVQLASYNPARIFGFNSKGSIKKGKDADLVIIDTKNSWTVNKKDLFTKVGWSVYEGMELIGKPVATFVRGSKVYEHGTIVGEPQGKWLHKKN